MSARRERRLGWLTRNQQLYEAPQAADLLDAIHRQVCPFCNEGPFTVVALHVVAKHGISGRELRDIIGVDYQTSICDPVYSRASSRRTTAMHRTGVIPTDHLHGRQPGTRLSPATRRRMSSERKGIRFRTPKERGTCQMEGCGQPHKAKGLCMKHYNEAREGPTRPRGSGSRTTRVCDIEGCERPHRARGLCHHHYNAAARDGTLPGMDIDAARLMGERAQLTARIEKLIARRDAIDAHLAAHE